MRSKLDILIPSDQRLAILTQFRIIGDLQRQFVIESRRYVEYSFFNRFNDTVIATSPKNASRTPQERLIAHIPSLGRPIHDCF